MGSFKVLVLEIGLVAAATIGAGIFSLPYIFKESGWVLGILYLMALGSFIVTAHYFYWQVLTKTEAKNRLLGLVGNHWGKTGFGVALLAIVGGLVLALVVYLILGSQFVKLVFPSLGGTESLAIFWFVSSTPLIFKLKRLAGLELLGAILMTVIIITVFFAARIGAGFEEISSVNLKNLFLPFGAILFSLAAWTAVEPVYDLGKNYGIAKPTGTLAVFLGGTLFPAFLYFLFIAGIYGSASVITTDTVSGLTNWPVWKTGLLGLLGIFAIWTSYVPIGLEIKNSLEKDLKWNRIIGSGLVLFLPPLLIILGLNNFLRAVGLAGGVFLSVQYLLIILVSRKVLELSRAEKLLLNSLGFVFILAAVYEIYYFVLH